jgi:curved DNA-binding protein CbpA
LADPIEATLSSRDHALNLLRHLSHRLPQRRRRDGELATDWSMPSRSPPRTLYELLRVRPHDDAETLQGAFRDAVKANHPDVNPGDPDAPRRFSQIVTAYGILRDAEQRKAYDRLLATERARRRARLTRTVASDVVAIFSISAVLVGGYALFAHVSRTPAGATSTVGTAARQSIEMTAVQRMAPTEGSDRGKSASAEPGGPVANATEPKAEAAAAVDVHAASVDLGEGSTEVADRGKSDESDPPDQTAARPAEPQPLPPKDIGAAKASLTSSPKLEEKRAARTQMHTTRPIPDRAAVRQAAPENRDAVPGRRNARAAPPLFGLGF